MAGDGKMEGVLSMSAKERDRLRVIEAVQEKGLRQAQAAQRLGLSVRQIKRLVRAYRQHGAQALVSKRRGRPSNRRIGDLESEQMLASVRAHYADFGPTLAAEYLSSYHGFTRSVQTLRQWMVQAGLWRAKTAARSRTRRAKRSGLDVIPYLITSASPACSFFTFGAII